MHCRHIILTTLHFQEYINTKTLKISFDITYKCWSSLTACAQHGAESSSLRIVIGISHCKHFQHNLHTLFVQQIKPFLSVNRVYFHFDMPKYTQNRAVWLSACSSDALRFQNCGYLLGSRRGVPAEAGEIRWKPTACRFAKNVTE